MARLRFTPARSAGPLTMVASGARLYIAFAELDVPVPAGFSCVTCPVCGKLLSPALGLPKEGETLMCRCDTCATAWDLVVTREHAPSLQQEKPLRLIPRLELQQEA